ncbi:DEAD/DEAH box helicase [Paraferrimonas sp. SM1919]|uniref:preprotein translocase subunit SecA n=1 Tax=Paraferrimonas sp. SM1919 TaxID=2662263 RepID=UPI0013D465F1|nr:DEAD/DEAH box helicase [Paraferrimonas sp. SM1919]
MSNCLPYPLPQQTYLMRWPTHNKSWEDKLQGYLDSRANMQRVNSKQLKKLHDNIANYYQQLANLESQSIAAKKVELQRLAINHGINLDFASQAFALIGAVCQQQFGYRPFPTQFEGAWVLMSGLIAEMDTGQGKTLTAAIAATTMAIAGVSCHVITVNEYLAKRDVAALNPIYEAFNLTTAVITEGMTEPEKVEAYKADIVYCTNKQVVFDHLRDRMKMGSNTPAQLALKQGLLGDKAQQLMLPGLVYAIVDEADSILADEAITPLIISSDIDTSARQEIYQTALMLAKQLQQGKDFIVDKPRHFLQFTLDGQNRLSQLCQQFSGLWQVAVTREMLVLNGLKALYLFNKDFDYLVADGKVVIIDQSTGRVMADRSWEQGLHQLIELKEGLLLSKERQTIGSISYQRFFKRYLLLAGMTGTAKEISKELAAVYGLSVVRIEPYQNNRRKYLEPCVFATGEQKMVAIVARVKQWQRQHKAILIGTQSVQESELLSQFLQQQAMAHQLLNARQDEHEAKIIAQAGQPGQITIATNMAGRGTDIKLSDTVANSGGLHIIVTQLNDYRRVDRQLFGRAARQGDPGVVQLFLSKEDDFFKRHVPNWLLNLLKEQQAGLWLAPLVKFIQNKNEQRAYKTRKQLSQQQEYLADYLAITGQLE